MNPYSFLCFGGTEIANGNRTTAYIQEGLLGPFHQATCAPCEAIEDVLTYINPSTDEAPWWDENVWASDEFLGVLLTGLEVQSPFARSVSTRPSGGGAIGKVRLRPRVMSVQGLILASSTPGMAYGESWLREVLYGSRCSECGGDDVIYLPACPDDIGYVDTRNAFRRLVGAGITDGPVFGPLGAFPTGRIQQVSFQIAAASPFVYQLPDRCLEDEPVLTGISCSMTTLEWGDGGTFKIDLTNSGATTATDITITGQISLDGSCPVTGLGSSVPPSWSYTIPTLEPEGRLVIDGERREVLFYDPSDKFMRSGFSKLALPPGKFRWPDIGPCTTICITIERATGDVLATVDTSLREV